MFEAYADPAKRAKTVRSLQSATQVTRLGPGALYDVGTVSRQQGIKHALLITDGHMLHTESGHFLQDRLREAGVRVTPCTCVTPTPLTSNVNQAVAALQEHGCDGIVSFGGGSAHDIGKGAALLGKHGGTIHAWAHGDQVVESTLPHVAVNTTAGTGAEMSSYAFFVREHGHEHTILWHDVLVPDVAVIDPLTHISMPKHLTAATGLNALSDAVEAYVSRSHTAASDEAALQAIGLIHDNLPRAYSHPDDLDARSGMAEAAYLAGLAFNEAGLGIVDSISLVLSGLFNVGHSTANAIVLPHVMAYDAFSVGDRMGDIAKALSQPVKGKGPKEMAEAAIEGVVDLKRKVGLTENLADRGLMWDDLYLCANAILHHPFIKRSPRELDAGGLQEILLNAMESSKIMVGEPPAEATA